VEAKDLTDKLILDEFLGPENWPLVIDNFGLGDYLTATPPKAEEMKSILLTYRHCPVGAITFD
jgi:hypothetical protein